jgi:outer membrane receptor protein involved in Fe transport
MKSSRNRILMLGIAAELFAAAAAAQAPAAAPGNAQLDDVVVTASRVSREGFNAPTPTTVIGELQLEARGFTNITDAINETPVFRASNGPATAQRGGASSGGSSLDLRGLNGGVARTLVLIDGRRHVPSTVSGLVDLNMIPTGLVERTEVVTGGASAAWGSDAVAGVVNILLKDNLQGFQSHVAYAQTGHNDYIESTVNLAGGTGFAGGRGHVIAGFDYVKNDGIADGFRTRDWMAKSWTGTLFNYGAAPRPAGVPQRVFSEDFRNGDTASSGGVIVGGPLDNITFLGGQNTGIFTPGTLVAGTNMIGGGANNSNADLRVIDGSNLVNPIERNSALVRVKYSLTDNLEAFIEGSRAVSAYEGFSASRRDQGTIVVRQDNAFLPTAIRTQMVNLNLATINVGRIATDDNYNYYSTLTGQQTERVVGGFKGDLGGSWKWDMYYQYGQNHFKQRNQSTLNANFTAATDAILVGGQIVCRSSTVGGADPNCVPFNIFGRNSPSQAAVDYVRGVGVNDVTYRQQVGAVNVNGDLFNLPAGAVAVAAGAEYRMEEVASKVDNNSFLRRFDLNNFQPIAGSFNTQELYGEVAVPILRDKTFFQSLDANGAVRYTDYSTSGGVTTWKFGGSWEPIQSVRFRATQSRDIRAPNLQELYAKGVQGRDFVNGAQQNSNNIGNPNLVPEEAKTFTAGIVFQPTFVPRLSLSADYHDIKIEGAITRLNAQQVFDRCAAGATELCGDITYLANGTTISSVTLKLLNFNAIQTSGWDFEAVYSLPRDLLVPGQFQVRALGALVNELSTTDSAGTIDRVKQTVPDWLWTLDVNYIVGQFTGNAQVRYVSDAVRDTTLIGPDNPAYNPALPNTISDNTVPAALYLNLSAQYDLVRDGDKRVQIYGVVNNVLDKDPPEGAGGFASGFVNYDLLGRLYRAGVRFNF